MIRGVDGHDAVEIKTDRHRAEVGRQTDADLPAPRSASVRRTRPARNPATVRRWAEGRDRADARGVAPPYAPFEIPQAIYDGWKVGDVGKVREHQWNQLFDAYAQRHPTLPRNSPPFARELPEGFRTAALDYALKLQAEGPNVASRKASQMAIRAFAPLLPELVGGSADLAHST